MSRSRLVALAGAPSVPFLLVLGLAAPADAQTSPVTPPTCDAAVYRCPDMVARAPAELRMDRTPRGRLLLRATNRLDNVGDGPLDVRGARTSSAQRLMRATQVVRRRGGGSVLRRRAGTISFKPIPGQGAYWKFDDALRFELRRTGARGALVRTGPKVVYCLRDLRRQPFRRAGAPRDQVFPACDQGRRTTRVRMGVSVGWRESYPAPYHEQYVDVTGLRGCFNLWHVADPRGRLIESDETNNANRTRVRLPAPVGRRPARC